MSDPGAIAWVRHSLGPAPGTWSGVPARRVLEVWRPEDIPALLEQVEQAVEREGMAAAGFLSYEAAPGLDRALRAHPHAGPTPLAWFALCTADAVIAGPPPLPDGEPAAESFLPALSRGQHGEAVRRVHALIASGDTYQVNLTFPLRAENADAGALAAHLLRAQPTAHAAWIRTAGWSVASASPELFYRLRGDAVEMRPMKGTRGRGRHRAEDEALEEGLRASAKDRAENVMIVDMVRSDLGRVCAPGSVRVDRLFATERHPTVWQMTSTVSGRTRAGLPALMRALFPCASVTGAPKVRTMEIIRELEPAPRGVYTGCVGLLLPGRRHEFNVAIRTLVLDHTARRATYGVGSGVVWDSTAGDEHAECLQKAAVLARPAPGPVTLLETMRWTPDGGVWLRREHLERLRDSALFLGLPDPTAAVEAALDAFRQAEPLRLRLLWDEAGGARLEHAPLPEPRAFRLALDTEPTRSDLPWLFHKTTRRAHYDAARARAPGGDDTLMWNERGELTEATIANLLVRLDGVWWTPPVDSGLLPGTLRRHLLESGDVRERVLRAEDLDRAEAIELANSVRGRFPATLVSG